MLAEWSKALPGSTPKVGSWEEAMQYKGTRRELFDTCPQMITGDTRSQDMCCFLPQLGAAFIKVHS